MEHNTKPYITKKMLQKSGVCLPVSNSALGKLLSVNLPYFGWSLCVYGFHFI